MSYNKLLFNSVFLATYFNKFVLLFVLIDWIYDVILWGPQGRLVFILIGSLSLNKVFNSIQFNSILCYSELRFRDEAEGTGGCTCVYNGIYIGCCRYVNKIFKILFFRSIVQWSLTMKCNLNKYIVKHTCIDKANCIPNVMFSTYFILNCTQIIKFTLVKTP